MATFEVPVVQIDEVLPHPNADRLELAQIGGYVSIVQKGVHKKGDVIAYIPEGAIVPDVLIEEMGLTGRLAGSKKNRVKAVKLRQVLSQGLVYPLDYDSMGNAYIGPDRFKVGEDISEALGIVKYEPQIPIQMYGKVKHAHPGSTGAPYGLALHFDVENIKKYPDVFEDGERVVVTEKLHGTWCCLGFSEEIGPIVTSKGLSAKSIIMDLDSEENDSNLYVRAWKAHSVSIVSLYDKFLHDSGERKPVYVLGEIVGQGVQDMNYGFSKPTFRVFDIYHGYPEHGEYLSPADVASWCGWTNQRESEYGLESVPTIYDGPFGYDVVNELTQGKTETGGNHMREGVVIRPAEERWDPKLRRVMLKSVSEDYLLRKGGTEYD